MKALLDTDVCSYLLKRTHPALKARVREFAPGGLGVSTVSVFELEFGARRLDDPDRWSGVIAAFLDNLEIMPLDRNAAREAAAVRAELERAGSPIGAYDLLIAGHARSLGTTLVTHNLREFQRVAGLRVESWIE